MDREIIKFMTAGNTANTMLIWCDPCLKLQQKFWKLCGNQMQMTEIHYMFDCYGHPNRADGSDLKYYRLVRL